MKVLFIGAGNMAQAIISGIIQEKIIKSNQIFIYEVNEKTAEIVLKKYKIGRQREIDKNISEYNIIFLAVKPQVFLSFFDDSIMNKIKKFITNNQLIVSIMAGITIEKIKSFFSNENPVVRIMPNTPALIGQSMSVISPSTNVSKVQLEKIKNIFSSIGKIEILEEKYINAITGLSGSGPAYVFTFIEAMIQSGIISGLPNDVAKNLALQTVIGSALMINKSKDSIEELIHKVTSPGGTTIQGLSVLEKNNFKNTIIEAVKASVKRAEELSK